VAARLNTMVWGGIANPIIPVGEDAASAAELADRFSLDVLHPVVAEPQLREVVERFPHLRLPREISMHGLFQVVGDDEIGLATVRVLASHYYETVVRYGGGKSRAVWMNWKADDPLAPLWTLLFGDYGEDVPGPRCRRAFHALEAEEVRIDESVPAEVLDRVTPVRFTLDALRRAPGWFEGHGLVIGDPSDLTHLVRFWNLRSTGANVAFWPTAEAERLQEYCLEHLKRTIPVPKPGSDVAIGPFLWRCDDWPRDGTAQEAVPEPVSALFEELDVRPRLGHLDDGLWTQPLHRPAVWSSRGRRVLANVEDDRWGKKKMVFSLPPHPFESGHFDHLWHTHWLTTLGATGEYNYPGFTIRLPSIPKLNEWASSAVTVIGDVRLADGAIGVVTEPRDTSLEVNLVEEAEVVRRVFGLAGIEAEVSPAGRAVTRIVEQMGGLLGCRPFRLPGVRRMLARSSATYSWRDALREIHDKGTYSAYTNVGTAAQTFQRLLENGVFQAGLHLRCSACTITSRYLPSVVDAEIRCARCGTPFSLAPALADSHWEYQASGFFAHHGEHGAIPVILTMLRLEHDVEERALFLAPSHTLKWDGFDCESDFLALSQRHDATVVVAVGESKGGPQEIGPDDLKKLTAVADRMRAVGIECYVVLATTRDSFSDEEMAAFRAYTDAIEDERSIDDRVQGWRRPYPILFTWRELRSFEAYDREVRDEIPEPYAHSFRELAANATFMYYEDNDVPDATDEDLHI
jgi:hypothetical protein